ncbi:hypothetical protein L9F63_006859, partial [Diploptera punctata]
VNVQKMSLHMKIWLVVLNFKSSLFSIYLCFVVHFFQKSELFLNAAGQIVKNWD